MKTRQNWFITPTGDYYTTSPISLEKAKELVEIGVRTVIVPHVWRDDWYETERYLFESGITIRCVRDDIQQEMAEKTG